MASRRWLCLAFAASLASGCPAPTVSDAGDATAPVDATVDGHTPADVESDTGPIDAPPVAPEVRMDFASRAGFYDAPFPSEHRRLPSGLIDLTAFPNPRNVEFVTGLVSIAAAVDGFGTTSGIYFTLSTTPDPARLPDYHSSTGTTSPVFLLSVQAGSPDRLRRYPVSVEFHDDAGPFGARNMLSLLPLQGAPLRPRTLYAAVVMRDIWAPGPLAPVVPASLTQLIAGVPPSGMAAPAFAAYQSAIAALREAAVDIDRIAGLAVFETAAPAEALSRARRDVLASALPVPTSPFVRGEVFPDYCVYRTTIGMPTFQQGMPPFATMGGGWSFDAAGHLVPRGTEQANFVVTVPRRAMPAAGFPAVVFIRTGGGGDRPLVDRGVHAVRGGPEITPGSGPAMEFAGVGYAGASVDGPLGGLRNVSMADEQFLVFNVNNLLATRDNIRQSALELMLLAHVLRVLNIDASDCPGVTTPAGMQVHFDTSHLALMGHSIGATIAPLVLAHEPLYRAGIFSGAGGSFIHNVMYKRRPVEVRPIAELLVRYNGTGRHLYEHDPILSVLQWAAEPADPPVYAATIIREPPGGVAQNILMLQGIVDNYLLPPMANATSLSIGLDLAGMPLDVSDPQLSMFAPLGTQLDLAGRQAIALPAQGNLRSGSATGVVVQHREDGLEDGHETVYQTEGPKHQYRCFLASLLTGVPRVPSIGPVTAPCD